MRKLLESTYRSDPRFARAPQAPARQTAPACPPLQSHVAEPAARTFIAQSPAPRVRSGLAYGAGYAGLAYLFGFSFSAFVFGTLGLRNAAGELFVLAWGMTAPAALALGLAAGVRLDRSPEKTGRLPALLGFTVGMVGTINWAVALVLPLRPQ